jgi:hypothetical protein
MLSLCPKGAYIFAQHAMIQTLYSSTRFSANTSIYSNNKNVISSEFYLFSVKKRILVGGFGAVHQMTPGRDHSVRVFVGS